MTDWIRRQLSLHNLLLVATLVATLLMNTGRWVAGLTTDQDTRARQIDALIEATHSLTIRVEALERSNLQLSDIVAANFPRRTELEPRLKAIEDRQLEMNMLMRQLLERYRKTGY